MTTNLKQNTTNISQPQEIINNPSFNREEIENPTFPITHNNACSLTHNNTLSNMATDEINTPRYYDYILGEYEISKPVGVTLSYRDVIEIIFYRRSDLTEAEHVELVKNNALEYISMVKCIIERDIRLNNFKNLEYFYFKFLDITFSHFERETRDNPIYNSTNVFVSILNELMIFLRGLRP